MNRAERVVEIGRRGDYDGLEGLSRNGRGDVTSVGETPASTRSSPATVRFVADSPLEEGVSSEPVSESPKFPASSELTGIFRRLGLSGA